MRAEEESDRMVLRISALTEDCKQIIKISPPSDGCVHYRSALSDRGLYFRNF